ncbi:MAG: MBL fold metallo-hydrolase, partial [Atopobiaceae bacterium]|nr:MBL fold metallo-hydrolase [Atopobiaceae bacterium]
MSINGSFRFHPVGQGLFYTGLLSRVGGGSFSFVYDCGTMSDQQFLRREIDDFKLLLPHASRRTRRLDLLVVSHMHDDHVSGLEYLLENLEVDTVVIPCTDQVTSLLARLESSGDDDFLRLFYADPVDWLSS